MIVKGMDDIRLWRSTHPQIAAQMSNLEPYILVSNQPSISRDMSIVIGVDTELEDICEQITLTLIKLDLRTEVSFFNAEGRRG